MIFGSEWSLLSYSFRIVVFKSLSLFFSVAVILNREYKQHDIKILFASFHLCSLRLSECYKKMSGTIFLWSYIFFCFHWREKTVPGFFFEWKYVFRSHSCDIHRIISYCVLQITQNPFDYYVNSKQVQICRSPGQWIHLHRWHWFTFF